MEEKRNVQNQLIEEEAKEIEESPERLKKLLEAFTKQQDSASFRKTRCEMLMKRRSAKKWKPQKTARMVRRYITATQENEQAVNAIDHITHRLEQLGAK